MPNILDPLTPQEQAVQLVSLMRNQTLGTFQQLVRTAIGVFNAFWKNPNTALTPDIIVAAMGTSAATFFTTHEEVVAFVNNLKPGTLNFVPPRAYTKNADGTVTLTKA